MHEKKTDTHKKITDLNAAPEAARVRQILELERRDFHPMTQFLRDLGKQIENKPEDSSPFLRNIILRKFNL